MKNSLPRVNFLKIRKVIVGLFVILGVFCGGYLLGVRGYKAQIKSISDVKIVRDLPANQKETDFSQFWRVWDILSASYYDKTKLVSSQMVLGAIQGMVAAIGDPYTVFLPPTENKVVQEDLSGNFQGIGIQIGFKGKQLAVIAPLPGTPAEKAGIRAGDFIIGIKDEKKDVDRGTVGMSLNEAVEIIRGPKGTNVTLALLRDGSTEPIIVKVAREEINVPSVIVTYVGKNKEVAHIRLLKFGGETETEWNKAVSEILKKNPKGIVLDLRNNPGGYLQGAVDIAGDFLKTGTVVVIEEQAGDKRNEFKTDRLPRLSSYPLIILVNKGSASASEILSGALREQLKITLVGDTTFGKGTIQEPKQLTGGAGLHITIAKWLTPRGNWVHEKGLDPDVKIDDDQKTTEDEQLQKAIELLKI
jgi:carboxyl-terminal processing protease